MTHQLYFPGSNCTIQNFEHEWPGDTIDPNVLVIHDTEGPPWPGYGSVDPPLANGAKAPHMTYDPKSREKRSHFPANMSSRSLVNLPGGDETNTLNVWAIEVIGTCDPVLHAKYPDLTYMPAAPDTVIDDLAHIWLWLHEQWSVPLTGVPAARWIAYPHSYGPDNGVRMTEGQWEVFEGVCGHQHVVENVHGDPGAFPFARLLTRVRQLAGVQDPPAGVDDLAHQLMLARGTAVDLQKANPGVPLFDELVPRLRHDWNETDAYRNAHQ